MKVVYARRGMYEMVVGAQMKVEVCKEVNSCVQRFKLRNAIDIPSSNAEIVSLNESVYLRVVESKGKDDRRSYVAGNVGDCRGRISRARV